MQAQIHASRNDLAYVILEVPDAKEQLVSNAVRPLHFSISGDVGIIATGNAHPSDMESFQRPEHKTFEGNDDQGTGKSQ